MKKSRIIVLLLFTTITLAGCTTNQDNQLQQQNDLLQQQNTLLQQQANQQNINTGSPGYVTGNTNITNGTNGIDNTKTIPFEAVWPANNDNTF